MTAGAVRRLIIQRVVPHYRAPLFEALHARTGAMVLTARRPPSGTFLDLVDPASVPWAIPADFGFAKHDPYWSMTPVFEPLARLRPTSVVAEFGVRNSSSYTLPLARSLGLVQRYAFWSHGWQMERSLTSLGDSMFQSARLQLLRSADVLATYSEEGADWIRSRAPDASVIALGNGLDTSAMEAAAKTSSPIKLGAPQLLAIGRMTPDKKFDELIRIFQSVKRELPDAALVIIGDGPERAKLERLAAELSLSNVHFVGALHEEAALAPYFLGSSLMVMPGAAGLAVNHALAYRLPVIAYARGEAGPRHHPEIEYVLPGVSGILVDQPTSQAMSAAIVDSVRRGHDQALRKGMSGGTAASPSVSDMADRFVTLFDMLEGAQGSVARASSSAAAADLTNPERPIAFVWDNFGPMHDDRCAAVAKALGAPETVLGIELYSHSDTYQWRPDATSAFRKVTLETAERRRGSSLRQLVKIVRECLRADARHIFLCHYERPEILGAAVALRLLGRRVYTMNDSKFDDYERVLWRELAKRVWQLPYCGALSGSARSGEYLRFLGHRPAKTRQHYNAISVERIRAAASGVTPEFDDRGFIVVARLVPKKDIATVIRAYALYREAGGRRGLVICGSGPLEGELRALATELGVAETAEFLGFAPWQEVSRRMAGALALLHASVEEQFGLVIAEAQALGLPVIVSTACGACDSLVRSGVNGFAFEPGNARGLSFFMQLLDHNEALWRKLSEAATAEFAPKADVSGFVESVQILVTA